VACRIATVTSRFPGARYGVTVSDVAVPTPRRHRARHTASVILLVFVVVLTPLVVTAGWAITTVTNTDRFVSTMSSLSTNPVITNYAAAQGAATVATEIHLQMQIEERLPKAAAALAPLLTTQVTTLLTKAFSKILASPQFQAVWTAKLRLVHAAFVTAMTSNGSKLQKAGQLGLDVTPQLLAAIATLDAQGYHFLDPAKKYLLGNKPILVSLAQGKEFHQVQYYFHIATTLRWALWVGTLVLAIAAILLDPRRRRAGFWLGVGVACSCVVMLALLATGKQYAMSHSTAPQDVTNVLFSTLTSYLRWELRAVVIVGLLAALVLWLTGPSRSARSLRRVSAKGGTAAGHAAEGVLGESTTASIETRGTSALDWVAAHATPIAWLGIVVGAIVLAAWVDSLLGAVIVILLVVAWFSAVMAVRRRAGTTAPIDGG
jgi:hypothetical protein